MQFTATVLTLISIAPQENMALKAKDNLRHLRKHFMPVFYEIATSLFSMFSRFCDILQCWGAVQSRAF